MKTEKNLGGKLSGTVLSRFSDLTVTVLLIIVVLFAGCKKIDPTEPDNNKKSAEIFLSPMGEIFYTVPVWVKWEVKNYKNFSVLLNGEPLTSACSKDSIELKDISQTQTIEVRATGTDGIIVPSKYFTARKGDPIPTPSVLVTLNDQSVNSISVLFNGKVTLKYQTQHANVIKIDGIQQVSADNGTVVFDSCKSTFLKTIEVSGPGGTISSIVYITVADPTYNDFVKLKDGWRMVLYEVYDSTSGTWAVWTIDPTRIDYRYVYGSDGVRRIFDSQGNLIDNVHWYIEGKVLYENQYPSEIKEISFMKLQYKQWIVGVKGHWARMTFIPY